MILKWLVTGLIAYFFYKRFFALPAPKKEEDNRVIVEKKQGMQNSKDADEEYIDYEEVD